MAPLSLAEKGTGIAKEGSHVGKPYSNQPDRGLSCNSGEINVLKIIMAGISNSSYFNGIIASQCCVSSTVCESAIDIHIFTSF